jgi:hypothetical protein
VRSAKIVHFQTEKRESDTSGCPDADYGFLFLPVFFRKLQSLFVLKEHFIIVTRQNSIEHHV